MRLTVSIFFLVYYGLGSILFPMGDISYVRDLPQMYNHCAAEDPDINVADFVFEHLLNIHEDEDDADEHERPHQAVYNHAPVQMVAMCYSRAKQATQPAVIPLWYDKEPFPIMQHGAFRPGHLSDVFRPPAIIS